MKDRVQDILTEWRWFKKKIDIVNPEDIELFHITDSSDNYPDDEYACITLVCVFRKVKV